MRNNPLGKVQHSVEKVHKINLKCKVLSHGGKVLSH